MSQDITIRRATPADRAAIGRLWQELMAFHHQLDPEAFELREDALDIWLPWLDEWLADPDRIVLVADTGRALVGYTMGRPEEGPPVFKRHRHGAIWDTCVTQALRRRGVGRKLVAALVDWFRERGLAEAHVSAAARNPVSNAFWRAAGFRPHMIQMRRLVDLDGR
jgi:ribosomal protein S18 acetylase RimI-like enzyme